MHMGRGSLTILDGQFRLRQHCAVVFQFLHPVDLFGWKDAFNAKVLRRQTKSSVTKWQETIETLQDMWFTRWPSLQTMTNSPVAGSTIWNARITLLRLWKNTFGNCVWVRYQSNDAQSQTKWYRLTIVWFILKQHVVSGKHSPCKTSQPLTTYFLTFAVGPKKGTCIMCSMSELKVVTWYILFVIRKRMRSNDEPAETASYCGHNFCSWKFDRINSGMDFRWFDLKNCCSPIHPVLLFAGVDCQIWIAKTTLKKVSNNSRAV